MFVNVSVGDGYFFGKFKTFAAEGNFKSSGLCIHFYRNKTDPAAVGGDEFPFVIEKINEGKIGETAQKLYDTLYGIQSGKVEDTLNWTVKVCD